MPDLATIRANLAKRDDQELLDIWVEHDTTAWTSDAFQAVSLILTERGIALLEPGGISAEKIRQARMAADTKRLVDARARFGRGVCQTFALILALPVAGIWVALLAGIVHILPIPEKWSIELAAFSTISIYATAAAYFYSFFIRKYASNESRNLEV